MLVEDTAERAQAAASEAERAHATQYADLFSRLSPTPGVDELVNKYDVKELQFLCQQNGVDDHKPGPDGRSRSGNKTKLEMASELLGQEGGMMEPVDQPEPSASPAAAADAGSILWEQDERQELELSPETSADTLDPASLKWG